MKAFPLAQLYAQKVRFCHLAASDSDFYYYALFTKYNKINIYRNFMKYKKKEIKQYITRKIVLSDQSSISFRVGH